MWMQEAYGLTAADRVLQKTPYSFDVSVWEFFWPLISGATLVVAHPGGHQDSGYLVELIRRERISVLHFVPSMLRVFLEEENLRECTSLRLVVTSGEALPYPLARRVHERLPAVAVGESLRSHGSVGGRDALELSGGGRPAPHRADRPADRQYADLRAVVGVGSVAGGRGRGTVSGRRGPGAGAT